MAHETSDGYYALGVITKSRVSGVLHDDDIIGLLIYSSRCANSRIVPAQQVSALAQANKIRNVDYIPNGVRVAGKVIVHNWNITDCAFNSLPRYVLTTRNSRGVNLYTTEGIYILRELRCENSLNTADKPYGYQVVLPNNCIVLLSEKKLIALVRAKGLNLINAKVVSSEGKRDYIAAKAGEFPKVVLKLKGAESDSDKINAKGVVVKKEPVDKKKSWREKYLVELFLYILRGTMPNAKFKTNRRNYMRLVNEVLKQDEGFSKLLGKWRGNSARNTVTQLITLYLYLRSNSLDLQLYTDAHPRDGSLSHSLNYVRYKLMHIAKMVDKRGYGYTTGLTSFFTDVSLLSNVSTLISDGYFDYADEKFTRTMLAIERLIYGFMHGEYTLKKDYSMLMNSLPKGVTYSIVTMSAEDFLQKLLQPVSNSTAQLQGLLYASRLLTLYRLVRYKGTKKVVRRRDKEVQRLIAEYDALAGLMPFKYSRMNDLVMNAMGYTYDKSMAASTQCTPITEGIPEDILVSVGSNFNYTGEFMLIRNVLADMYLYQYLQLRLQADSPTVVAGAKAVQFGYDEEIALLRKLFACVRPSIASRMHKSEEAVDKVDMENTGITVKVECERERASNLKVCIPWSTFSPYNLCIGKTSGKSLKPVQDILLIAQDLSEPLYKKIKCDLLLLACLNDNTARILNNKLNVLSLQDFSACTELGAKIRELQERAYLESGKVYRDANCVVAKKAGFNTVYNQVTKSISNPQLLHITDTVLTLLVESLNIQQDDMFRRLMQYGIRLNFCVSASSSHNIGYTPQLDERWILSGTIL